MKTKVGELWDFVKPPAVEEDDSDTGTALYASPLHLFGVRLILATGLMILAFARSDRWDYRFYFGRLYLFSHIPAVFYVFQSVTFLVLAAASLCITFDFPVRVCGPFVEVMYFTSGALSIAGSLIDSTYYPALIVMSAHYLMSPKIRVRPWFAALSILSYVPHLIYEVFSPSYPNYIGVLGYFLMMAGHGAGGVMVFGLTEMLKQAEFRQDKQEGIASRPASYSAI